MFGIKKVDKTIKDLDSFLDYLDECTLVDILQLLERLDNIVRLLYRNLCQFEIEVPFIPDRIKRGLFKIG